MRVAFQATGDGKGYVGFISHHPGDIEELHGKLEWVETNLAVAQKAVANGAETLKLVEGEKGTIWAEVDWLKEKGEAMEAKYKGTEQENSQLKREVDELRANFAA